jgi:hypothetical protein
VVLIGKTIIMANTKNQIVLDLTTVDQILEKLRNSQSDCESMLECNWEEHTLEDYLSFSKDIFEIKHLIKYLDEKKRIPLTT